MNRRLAISRITIFAVILGLLCSCSDNPASLDDTTPQLAWEAWENPEIDPYYSCWFTAIWGNSEGDLYVVGQQGMVFHFNGRDWEFMPYKDAIMLYDAWGNSQGDLYVVGSEGTILHYDGQIWESMESGTTANLYGIWGYSDNEVFAVGYGGTVLCYDGENWSSVDTGTDQTLQDVWGDGRNTFAIGDNGTILELHRHDTRKFEPLTTNTLYGIGGCPETGICAVGAAGTILRYDGSTWRGVRSGTTRSLKKVCGTPDGHLLAVGDRTALHFDGYEWEFMDMDEVSTSFGHYGMVGVWGTSIRDMFVLGSEAIAHYDGSNWNPIELPPLPSDHGDYGKTLSDIWGSSGSDVYAARASEGILRFDGSAWTSIGGYGRAVWGVAENSVFTVKTSTYYEGGGGIWGGDPENGWTVGTVSHYDGTEWTIMQELQDMSFSSIWGDSETDLFVVGSRTDFVSTGSGGVVITGFKYYPQILRYTGGAWSEVYSKEGEGSLRDVWGSSETDVHAVGSNGLIVHFDGMSWTEMNSSTDASLISVWGSSGSDIFAVGYNGTILHYDGLDWLSMNSGTTNMLYDVWGSSMSDVFAVGTNGTILHFDGTNWQQAMSPTINDLYGIWGSAPDDIFAVGKYGTILHYGTH